MSLWDRVVELVAQHAHQLGAGPVAEQADAGAAALLALLAEHPDLSTLAEQLIQQPDRQDLKEQLIAALAEVARQVPTFESQVATAVEQGAHHGDSTEEHSPTVKVGDDARQVVTYTDSIVINGDKNRAHIGDQIKNIYKEHRTASLVGIALVLVVAILLFFFLLPADESDAAASSDDLREMIQTVEESLNEHNNGVFRTTLSCDQTDARTMLKASSEVFSSLTASLGRHGYIEGSRAETTGSVIVGPQTSPLTVNFTSKDGRWCVAAMTALDLDFTVAPSTSSPPSTQVRHLASGTQIRTTATDIVTVQADGDVALAMSRPTSGFNTFYPIDLKTGEQRTPYTIPAIPQYGGIYSVCTFHLIKRGDGTSVVVTIELDAKPAEGAIPASGTRRLVARNAISGSQLWVVTGTKASTDVTVEKAYTGCENGNLVGVSENRQYVVASVEPSYEPISVDLASGRFVSLPSGVELVGDFLGRQVQDDRGATYVELMDVATGAVVTKTGEQRDLGLALNVEQARAKWADTTVSSFVTISHGGLIKYSLPQLGVIWETKHGSGIATTVIDESRGVIVTREAGKAPLVGYSLETGAELWRTGDADEFCGMHDGKAYVLANKQFATIDITTGGQLAFDPNRARCLQVLDGVFVDDTTDPTTLTKI